MTPSRLPLQPNGKEPVTTDEDKGNEKTEAQYDVEYVLNRTLETLSQVKNRFDNCGDVRYLLVIVTTEPVKKVFSNVKNRGIKTRLTIEITNYNLQH